MNKIGDQGKCSHQIEVDGRVRNNESKLIGEMTTSLNAFYYLTWNKLCFIDHITYLLYNCFYLLENEALRVSKELISVAQVFKSTIIQFTQTVSVFRPLVAVRDATWFIVTSLKTVEPVCAVKLFENMTDV